MSGIVDPSTPEREAIVLAWRIAEVYLGWSADDPRTVAMARRLVEPGTDMASAYAAVRARALADVAGWVEGMERRPEYTDGVCGVCEQHSSFCHCGTVDEVLDALLAKLREVK